MIRERLSFAQKRAEEGTHFLAEGLIVEAEYYQRLDAVSQLETLRLQTEARIEEARSARERLAIERRRIDADLERDLADLDQRLAQLKSQRRQTEANAAHRVVAPMHGHVTALQIRPGETADPTRPLMNITPPGADLVAELYLPSRAIGFIAPGQRVKIQFDAFPYQKFDVAEAEILRASKTALLPQELGVASQTPERLYRIEAQLDAQTIRAFGKDIPLQSGMELTADIVLEDRKLLEWLMEPLKSYR